MTPDAVISVRFMTMSEGGRQTAISIVGGTPYGVVLYVDGEAFDCRLLAEGQTLELGKTYELPIKFLNPSIAMPMLASGKAITLWEGKTIAAGFCVSTR